MIELDPRINAALGDRYTIERELGRGGMAVVYLATDHKLDRKVALKVLRPELAQSLGAERLRREIAIAARLAHPNILGLHDCGGDEPCLYYTMQYVEGETLRDRLKREKQLPIEDAIKIAQDVAAALSHAHAQGIVHRDIKPENILFYGGHAVVADFGIAKAVSEVGGEILTETGIAVGTPAYMSPEQAAGERDLDGRTDLYALGCVLYEMLAGEPPFTGPTVESVVHQHLAATPPPVTAMRPAVPPAVATVISRALAKVPADRFATAAQFDAAMRSPARGPRVQHGRPRPNRRSRYVLGVAAATVLVIATVVAGVPRRWLGPGSPSDTIRSVAVLPFDNLGGGDENEAFIAGLHHDLLTHLNRIDGLAVRSRTSVLSYVDRGMSIGEIGRALQVDAVMEGGVQWADGVLRVNAQLIEVGTDDHVWADQFDHETMTDLLTTQTAIVRRIARELGVRLSAEASERVARRPTENDEAYDLYLRAYPLVAEFRDPAAAVALLERAIAVDSGFALAYALLARATLGNRVSLSYGEAIDSGLTLARRAVTLDPEVGETQAALGLMLDAKMEFAAAEPHYQRAIELSPGNAFAYLALGELKTTLGKLDEAYELLRTAQVLDPSLRPVGFRLAEVLFEQRQYAEAIEVATSYMSLYPEFGANALAQVLGWAYVASGRYQEAIDLERQLQRRVDADAGNPEELRRLAECGLACVMALAGMGDTVAARASLRVLEREQRAGFRGRGARAYVTLGEYDRAFEMLEWWADGRYWRNLRLLTHPFWDPLRSDPRFDALLRRTGLG